MNEQFSPTQSPELTPRRTPGEAYLAPPRETPDWRRLEVAATRFGDRIAEGLSQALEHDSSIDNSTARLIAHVLGRAFGRMSALAGYGRTGEGTYEDLRDEYLQLYQQADQEWVTALVDTYGSYLIHQNHPTLQPLHYVGEQQGELSRLLVPTSIQLGTKHLSVHVPGTYDSDAIEQLPGTLADLRTEKNPALQAFISLPDTNVMRDGLIEDFRSNYIGSYSTVEEAIDELAGVDDRIEELHDHAEQRCLTLDSARPDYAALLEEMTNGFDIVEVDETAHAFYK